MKRAFRRTFGRRLIDSLTSAGINRGIGPSQRYLLTVTGRQTHAPHTTPVSVVVDGSMRYLVGPFGEVGWIRNARAAGAVTLSRAGHSEEFSLAPLQGVEAGSILKRYMQLEPMTRPYFGVAPDGPAEAFTAEVGDHPVFQLTPKTP
jgi:deazaflavin-dependent oxidoreductase (nitroreductase family)